MTDRTGGCGASGLRADAASNRERLLTAARRVFGRDGVGAPLTAVADEAGVGIATLYRRFPDRDALVSEAFGEALEAFDVLLDATLADPDPWHAFVSMVTGMSELEARDRGFTHLLQSAGLPGRDHEGTRQKGYTTAVEVVRRGQEAGVVRPDLSPEDLPVLTFAVAGILEATRDDAPEAWRRHVDLFLEGCRATPGAPALAPPVPPRDLRRAMIRAARRRTGLG
ncbi:TetR/AcrR family transcriptional regulator [Phycicoccus avicenniae]|uniref:TetR/AcrR family transcriptional regulator n=1 Tax=Phycicoccus avicenniae TaxID=2828860 RepID=UPI003D2DBA5C